MDLPKSSLGKSRGTTIFQTPEHVFAASCMFIVLFRMYGYVFSTFPDLRVLLKVICQCKCGLATSLSLVITFTVFSR